MENIDFDDNNNYEKETDIDESNEEYIESEINNDMSEEDEYMSDSEDSIEENPQDLQDLQDMEDPQVSHIFKKGNSIIRNKLTKYEFTRTFSLRVTQIQGGSVPMVPVEPGMTVEEIVRRELNMGRIPLIIERNFPRENGGVYREYRKINELINVSNF